ncbi:AAC(3)-I family aminoglycoside N-acetyltransferase [Leptospira sp. 96542]|nr:AAC(3)-I family aminoglycoside N-acetyltransferase [Leptospira sp. 96542]
MELNLRYIRLQNTDIELLRKLNEVFADAFEDSETHLSNQPSDDYLRTLLSKKDFITLVALDREHIMGGLVAYVLEKYEQARSEIYIYDLAVAEKYRRRGIARSLIQELKMIAKEIGAYVIFVQADKVDLPAVRLYESMGIKEEPYHFDISVI